MTISSGSLVRGPRTKHARGAGLRLKRSSLLWLRNAVLVAECRRRVGKAARERECVCVQSKQLQRRQSRGILVQTECTLLGFLAGNSIGKESEHPLLLSLTLPAIANSRVYTVVKPVAADGMKANAGTRKQEESKRRAKRG